MAVGVNCRETDTRGVHTLEIVRLRFHSMSASARSLLRRARTATVRETLNDVVGHWNEEDRDERCPPA